MLPSKLLNGSYLMWRTPRLLLFTTKHAWGGKEHFNPVVLRDNLLSLFYRKARSLDGLCLKSSRMNDILWLCSWIYRGPAVGQRAD